MRYLRFIPPDKTPHTKMIKCTLNCNTIIPNRVMCLRRKMVAKKYYTFCLKSFLKGKTTRNLHFPTVKDCSPVMALPRIKA